ncbi:MAG: GNAT family N-acetyltransferase [Saprospiraceae bacterium]|nr:GNAT family N-acetyltransferase [Saprospiraceae bacterium]
MDFRFLHSTPIEEIVSTFNKAFEGYFIPLKFDAQVFRSKLIQESIDLKLSTGAFEGSTLVGFIFVGVQADNHAFYNAGTGVIAEYRGQNLTQKMYEILLPKLISKGFKKGVLEVVRENAPAIHVYKTIGYEITRALECYKATQIKAQNMNGIAIKECTDWHLDKWSTMNQWAPSWQNDNTALSNVQDKLSAIEITEGDLIVAYAIFDKSKGRIHQMAVKEAFRRRGLGSAMLSYIQTHSSADLSWINVDSNDELTNNWLVNRGFELILGQYEMQLIL